MAGRCVDCGVAVSRRAERCRGCTDKAQIKPDALPTTARARKECQSQNTGVCAVCGRDDVPTHVHHKDRNPLNNDPGNLVTVCEPCHHALHAVEDSFGNPYSHRYLSFDRIVSIRHSGRERVYDLCMEAPNHNFVANGFVSHNSGPGPLLDLLAFDRDIILGRQGDRLTSLDVHDMTCMLHRIGQMGGVRRASGISFSDLLDLLMRNAKAGAFWTTAKQRNQANNTAVYEEKPSPIEFMEEWLSLAKSGNGERGIYNAGSLYKQLPRRRKKTRMRGNPCGEVYLKDREFCNLSLAILRARTAWAEVKRRVKMATVWGTIQSTMTNFKYLSSEWKKNCEEERLLGVDLLGHLDHELLRPGRPGREQLLDELLRDCTETNVSWSQRLGINPSAALTCGKPSGDSSCFYDTAAGFKPHHGQFYIRRLRFATYNPIAKLLKDSGVPWNIDYDDSGLLVFDFPCRAPEGAVLLGDQTAVEQLENWLLFKQHWTEHNPSVTIFVKKEEWLAVGHWVYENWDHIGGLSFSPFDGGNYPLLPYEAISGAEYEQRASVFPEIDWSRIVRYEDDDMTTLAQQFACTANGCVS